VNGMRSVVASMIFDEQYFDSVYNYLSAYTHTSPLSYFRDGDDFHAFDEEYWRRTFTQYAALHHAWIMMLRVALREIDASALEAHFDPKLIAEATRPTRSAELLGHRTYCGILASRSRWLAFEVSCRYGRRSGINFWMPIDTLYFLSTCHGLSLRCALRGHFAGRQTRQLEFWVGKPAAQFDGRPGRASSWTVAVIPATRRTPSGTRSISMCTGTR
jgi:hypothetical protein